MNEQQPDRNPAFTVIALAMLAIALTAPCALPNRVIAACALVVALLSIGWIVYEGYRGLRANRKALERDLEAMMLRAGARQGQALPEGKREQPQ